MFLLMFTAVTGATATYMTWSLLAGTKSGRLRKCLLAAAMVGICLIMPASWLLRRPGSESAAIDAIVWGGYLGMGYFSILFCLLVSRDLFRLAVGIGRRAVRWMGSPIRPSGRPPDPARRRFIGFGVSAGISLTAGVFTGIGTVEARTLPNVRRVQIPISALHPDLDGLSIVQITDIHVSTTLRRPFVERIVEAVNRIAPDLIAHTGDLVDGAVPRLADDVAPLAELRSTFGTFFVTGNHEYYSGAVPWIRELQRLGHDVLLNEHRLIQRGHGRLCIAGVTDVTGGRFISSHRSSPARALKGAPSADATILLAHQPKSIFKAAESGVDLQLSGHTHGGQLWPFPLLVGLTQPYVAGLHRHENTWIYVSRGTGYWGPPVRLGAPAEITAIRLVRAAAESV